MRVFIGLRTKTVRIGIVRVIKKITINDPMLTIM